ncbi:MAG: radical SAM protein [Chitinispirillaceae bacterium]|nr:radical SAM protein [Chitinispirillaceae bacterium]
MLLPQNNKLKIAVVIPPIEDFYLTPHRLSNAGARIVFEIIKEENFDTILIDAFEDVNKKRCQPLASSLYYLKDFIIPAEIGKTSFFTKFHHFGQSYEELAEKVLNYKPDVCMISCFAFCYLKPLIKLAEIIKKRNKSIIIVAGGGGVTVYSDYFLRNSSIDFTLGGEAEVSLIPFINFLKGIVRKPEEVPFLGWKEGEKRFYSPIKKFTHHSEIKPIIVKTNSLSKKVSYSLFLARGCNFSCRFCSSILIHGNCFRHCDEEQLENYLENLKKENHHENMKININLEDDNLLCDYDFLLKVLKICKKYFPKSTFTAENGIDYRLLSPKRCQELINYGFRQFNFTLGNISSEIMAKVKRENRVELYQSLLSEAKKYSIPVITYLICGFPEDTKENIGESIKYLIFSDTIIGISLFYPVPGIFGFDNIKFFDNIDPQLCCGASAYSWSKNIDTKTLITAFRLVRFINLLKSRKHTVEEVELISKTLQKNRLHTIIKEKNKRYIIEVPNMDDWLQREVLEHIRKKI